jgi:hypothetical protein
LSAHTDHAAPSRCENCGSALQGHYCHVCGQQAHNPLKHFGHAVEEVFESFWHLDGRIFRTLRDLFVPGRVAANYLAGHRVRYIAPLRLFIILTVITFFIGRLTLHFQADDVIKVDSGDKSQPGIVVDTADDGDDSSLITTAKSVDEVLHLRAQALRELDKARQEPEGGWLIEGIGAFAQDQIDDRARARMRELGATPEQMRLLDAPNTADLPGANPASAQNPMQAAGAPGVEQEQSGLLKRWSVHRLQRMKENAKKVQASPDEFVPMVLGAVPGALFLLVPLFALCLKLLYVRSDRSYLEHLVVALYSHALMLAALLLTFLLIGLQSLPRLADWAQGLTTAAASLILSVAVPLYLLWMQKRIYGQGWFKTLIKYGLLGSVYTVLLSFALIYAVLAGMSS